MDVKRAKEISRTPEVLDVTYQGDLIMIQQVDEKRETARVYVRGNPDVEMTVNVAELDEVK